MVCDDNGHATGLFVDRPVGGSSMLSEVCKTKTDAAETLAEYRRQETLANRPMRRLQIYRVEMFEESNDPLPLL